MYEDDAAWKFGFGTDHRSLHGILLYCHNMQDELNEMKSELDEAERTRDVALTALFAGVQQSAEVSQQVKIIRKDLGDKLMSRDIQVLFAHP